MCIKWQHKYVQSSLYYVRWIQKSIFNKYFLYLHRYYTWLLSEQFELIWININSPRETVIPKNVSFTFSTTDRQLNPKKMWYGWCLVVGYKIMNNKTLKKYGKLKVDTTLVVSYESLLQWSFTDVLVLNSNI